jgi:hypothetical protein
VESVGSKDCGSEIPMTTAFEDGSGTSGSPPVQPAANTAMAVAPTAILIERFPTMGDASSPEPVSPRL